MTKRKLPPAPKPRTKPQTVVVYARVSEATKAEIEHESQRTGLSFGKLIEYVAATGAFRDVDRVS